METLSLTLHQAKDTRNKAVCGTKDGDVIQSVHIDRDALGGHHPGGHIPAVSLETVSFPSLQPGNPAGASRPALAAVAPLR